jgi:hypothetical protein
LKIKSVSLTITWELRSVWSSVLAGDRWVHAIPSTDLAPAGNPLYNPT